MSEPVTEADFRPCYDAKCMNCDQSPTVQVFVVGKLKCDTELCGACAWGEADCIDPENW